MKRIAILLLGLGLGGCFESAGSLYGEQKPVFPFHDGTVITRDKDGKLGHFSLARRGDLYRFVITDKGEDFGEGYDMRFFPLAGLAPDMLVFEAAEVCKPADKACKPATAASPRFYGLARLTKTGAEQFNPVCAKDSVFAKLPGVTAKDYDTCDFTSRGALEKALLAMSRQPRKPDTVYRYQ